MHTLQTNVLVRAPYPGTFCFSGLKRRRVEDRHLERPNEQLDDQSSGVKAEQAAVFSDARMFGVLTSISSMTIFLDDTTCQELQKRLLTAACKLVTEAMEGNWDKDNTAS